MSSELTPNITHEIEDLLFFVLDYSFLNENSTILWPQADPSIAKLSTNATYPNIWVAIDGLGKSLYSVVLADLGQPTTPTILTKLSSLQYFTRNFTDVLERTPVGHALPGPAEHSYVQEASSAPIVIMPAFISAKYLCQVPSLNSMGSVIMTILLANLVLMGTSWTLVSFCAASWVRRSDISGILHAKFRKALTTDVLFKANYCQKCVECPEGMPSRSTLLKILPGKTEPRYSKVKPMDSSIGNHASLPHILDNTLSVHSSDSGIPQTTL